VIPYYIVVNPGESQQNITAFVKWSPDHKPVVTSGDVLPMTFHYKALAQIVADELGKNWVVWDGSNILMEAEKTYGIKVITE
jgi:hypothetical protein